MPIILLLIAIIAIFFAIRFYLQLKKIKITYKDIIDVDAEIKARRSVIDKEVSEKQTKIKELESSLDRLNKHFQEKETQLKSEYAIKKNTFDDLVKEVNILEEKLENISYGLYEPHFKYETSEEYKIKLKNIREKQATVIKDEKATYCPIKWQVGGSEREGQKMIKQASKLMLRAFNGECDSAIAKVSWNNIVNMEARIEKAFVAINKLGSTNQISITSVYFELKLQELRLEFEMQEKIYQEKEEQRQIKEQMREEEKARRDLERVQKEAEQEEARYEKALEKARTEMQQATGAKLTDLTEKIALLEQNLKQAQEQKQRAISQAQLTKSGHVYIISNIGAFGEDVYKIGMTRRLDPMDRVKELGDASVPFDFDVHAIIYSENAPELENIIHKKLSDKKVNLMNERREFFYANIDEIEAITKTLNLEFHLTKIAEAKEFRASESIRDSKKQISMEENNELVNNFPTSL